MWERKALQPQIYSFNPVAPNQGNISIPTHPNLPLPHSSLKKISANSHNIFGAGGGVMLLACNNSKIMLNILCHLGQLTTNEELSGPKYVGPV